MCTFQSPVSDMLLTVKSREVQRAMSAEAQNNRSAAARHFLAAAHLELVLSEDYHQAGQKDLAERSQISAASCFWRVGQPDRSRQLFDQIVNANPSSRQEIHRVIADLEQAS